MSSASATSSAEYQAKADECRMLAERSIRSADRARWLTIAEEWMALAQQFESKDDLSKH
jgi:hypothetical protein